MVQNVSYLKPCNKDNVADMYHSVLLYLITFNSKFQEKVPFYFEFVRYFDFFSPVMLNLCYRLTKS